MNTNSSLYLLQMLNHIIHTLGLLCLPQILQLYALELKYITYLTDDSIRREENLSLSVTSTYCEKFTQGNKFMKGDNVYHAKDAVLTLQNIIIASTEPDSSILHPQKCINNPQNRARHTLSVVPSIDKSHHGERYEGTAYYVGRWGGNNPYHSYIDTTFPVWIMLMAHRQSRDRGNSRCCVLVEDISEGKIDPLFDRLDEAIIPCGRCRTNNNTIYARHVVVHFPFEARPMHVYPHNWPQSNTEFELTTATEYALRQFRHFVFHRLDIPFPETHARRHEDLKVVYVKRPLPRELVNIDAIRRSCEETRCPIKFITAEGLGSATDQIKFFSQVDVMIGVEGAAFLHALHLPLNSVIIQLHPPRDVRHEAMLPNGTSVYVAKPYRFHTALSLAMGHTHVNLCLSKNYINVDLFFDTVRPFLEKRMHRGGLVDIAQP